ncbi:MAG: glycine cleavage T C-terminal barrel domain-containing protein, partial [Pseudomonadota bacterium]
RQPAAASDSAAGCRVTVADARQNGPTVSDGVAHLLGALLQRAHGSRSVGRVTLDGGPDGAGAEFDADTILVSGGWTPSVHLHCQAGGKLDWRTDIDALVPRAGTSPLKAVGAAAGTFGLAASLEEGHRVAGGDGPAPRAEGATWHIAPVRPDPSLTGRQWVDLQNDVTVKDVALAAREGYRSVEHLKRYTTLGMATDQGRTSNFGGLAAMAALTGRTIPETGTTTYRPPFAPVPLGVIGGTRRGERFAPLKRLPLEAAHRSHRAQMREYGGWLRPAVYGEDGLDENAAADDEARVARERVGLYDASPLGKIEVLGPGAAELMDFCGYIRMSTLAPGRARYGLMLNETGVVHDDGVVLRLAEDRFILSASSSHVASVRLILEEARQDRFDPSRVVLHDVTDGWVTLTMTGPRAGAVLASAGLPEALCDDAALPHMGVVETHWAHGRLRVARVSFTGDRSYELSVPARHGLALHAVLDGAVTAEGGRWIGLEAVLRLRAEKGYILIGKDTDGITMPHDIGWTRPREKRSDEFFGRRALFTPEASRPDRRQLVGLSVEGPKALPVGAHVVPVEGARRSLGFVTSSGHGPGVGRPVALAMIEGGRGLMGARVDVFHLGAVVPARIEAPCAFDPAGERLHA